MTQWTDEQEHARLRPQTQRVFAAMSDGEWHRTDHLCVALGFRNIGTLSSRIRDIKAAGEVKYERRKVPGVPGIWEYRLFVPQPVHQPLLPGVGL